MGEPVNNQDWQKQVNGTWIPFCKKQIHFHQDIIRKLKGFSWLEILTGIALTVLAFIFVRSDAAKFADIFLKLGPMIILAPFPAYQYTRILRSQQSMEAYESWKGELQDSIVKDLYPESLIKELRANRSALAQPN